MNKKLNLFNIKKKFTIKELYSHRFFSSKLLKSNKFKFLFYHIKSIKPGLISKKNFVLNKFMLYKNNKFFKNFFKLLYSVKNKKNFAVFNNNFIKFYNKKFKPKFNLYTNLNKKKSVKKYFLQVNNYFFTKWRRYKIRHILNKRNYFRLNKFLYRQKSFKMNKYYNKTKKNLLNSMHYEKKYKKLIKKKIVFLKISKYIYNKADFSKKNQFKKNFTKHLKKKVGLFKKNRGKKVFTVYHKKKIKKNKYFFKNNLIFTKKLFMIFVGRGLKVRVINMFIQFLNYINLKIMRRRWFFFSNNFKKIYKKTFFNTYMYQIKKNIFPIFNNLSFSKKGEKMSLPWVLQNNVVRFKKLNTLCCNWIKKSVKLRKEKTLFLKILSEIESIRRNNSNSINLKKQYYNSFYKNKYFIKFLKKKSWI